MSTISFGDQIFFITKLGDQKISIATMDDDQKHSVAKSRDYNFSVITQKKFDFFPRNIWALPKNINLPIKNGLISTIDPLMEKSSVVT
jgi:hypothetical protein